MSRKPRYPLKIKRPILIVSIIGMVLLLGLSKGLYHYFAGEKAPSDLRLRVQTVRVKQAAMPKVIETIGNLTAKRELKIKASGSGRVQDFLVDAGSWVNAGTQLVHIIAAPEVRAPFDGYLTDWLVKPGEHVAVGTELIDLVDTEQLSLTYRVPEQYAAELALDQTVDMSVRALPNEPFQGVVRFIAPVVDKKTHTILLRADISNAKHNLWPGMSARVRHVLATYPDALVIPESCLLLTMEGYQVFVVVKDKIVKRSVQIGERQGGRVHILSGITVNEPVVLARTHRIVEGTEAVAEDWTGDW